MEIYNIEELKVEQKELLVEISKFISDEAQEKNLYETERGIFRLLQKLGLSFLKENLAHRGTGKIDGPITVAGKQLPYHSTSDCVYLSIFGEIVIRRAYYWQPGEKGCCPLDAWLNLPQRRYSYLLCKWVQGTIVEEPYDKAIERFIRLLDIPISKLGQQNVARDAGAYFRDFYLEKEPFDAKTEGSVIGVEADGKGIRMIPSEKPEAAKQKPARRSKGEKSGGLRKISVATADFTFNPEPRTPEEFVEILMKERKIHADSKDCRLKQDGPKPREALNCQVAATMNGKKEAFEHLAERVHRRDPTGEKKIVILLDGEKALEDQIKCTFFQAGLSERVDAIILDIMHVMGYAWDAGTALNGEKNPKRIPWVRKQALSILQGRVGRVIGGLKQTLSKRNLKKSQINTLNKVITYFENHKHMMCYDKCLAAGYPISTGLIEGTCGSLIKDRADRSGSRWSKKGVQAVLNERAVMKNSDWDEYWNFFMASENQRLYADQYDLALAA